MSGKRKKINGLPEFKGPFKELIIQYINYKRAQGYHIHNPYIYRLREMDLFFLEMGITEAKITREMYEAYTSPKPPEKESNTERRRITIRGFAKYLASLGCKDIYTGFDDTRTFKKGFIPYVFSEEEAARMFRILNDSCANDPGYENDCFRIAMLLYYCCGLRKSEAQRLTVESVDIDTGKITILHGKNDVSRIVVASDSLLYGMKQYSSRYLQASAPDSYFLYPQSTRRQCERKIYDRFHLLLDEAAIPPKPDGRRQRLHDIRHTFCVRALEQMQAKGFDLYTSLPLLSKYLGHKHITETEYYLRLLDEHFGEILNKAAAYHPALYNRGGGQDE